MRVWVVSAYYPPHSWYGGGSHAHAVAHGLAALGHRVTVICQANGVIGADVDGSVRVRRITPIRVGFVRGARLYWGWLREVVSRLEWSAAVAREFRTAPIGDTPDVVVVPEAQASALCLARKHDAAVVVVCHTPYDLVSRLNGTSNPVERACVTRLERASLRRAEAVVFPSADLHARTAPMLGDRPVTEVIPNPVDADLFRPGNERERLAPPTLLHVGRLEAVKGVHDLADAIVRLARAGDDFRCVFLGHDSSSAGASVRARLAATLADVRDRVRFEEHVERAELPERYNRSDVCVVPSLYENCPYTVLEAMACGRAVVATRAGGIPELVEDGATGRLVPVGDAARLADTLRELFRDAGERKRLGERARLRVEERYAAPVVARRYDALLRRIAETRMRAHVAPAPLGGANARG